MRPAVGISLALAGIAGILLIASGGGGGNDSGDSSANNTSGKMTVKKFIDTFGPLARSIQESHRIPYLFSLAQWALESGWAASAPRFNLFGIKATPSWTGERQKLWTWEAFTNKSEFNKYDEWKPESLVFKNGKWYGRVRTWFRAYGSYKEALADWVKVITGSRYKAAFAHTDPKNFAAEIARAGYATDAAYTSKINTIIDTLQKA